MALSRDDILKAVSLPVETVEIEGLGAVNIKTLSVKEKEQYARRFTNADGSTNVHRSPSMMAALIAMCLVDDLGKPMFSEQEVNDLMPGRIGERLFSACGEVQGDGKEARELIAKNSAPVPVA